MVCSSTCVMVHGMYAVLCSSNTYFSQDHKLGSSDICVILY